MILRGDMTDAELVRELLKQHYDPAFMAVRNEPGYYWHAPQDLRPPPEPWMVVDCEKDIVCWCDTEEEADAIVVRLNRAAESDY